MDFCRFEIKKNMVYDKLENLELYSNLSKRMEMAINYLMMTDFSNMKTGKYELLGNEVIAQVSEYNTKLPEDAKWEAHKKYADIQYLVHGEEKMGFTFLEKVQSTEPYNEEKDIEFFKGEGNYIEMRPGDVFIFFPHDIHRPGIAISQPKAIKKVVIKVKV